MKLKFRELKFQSMPMLNSAGGSSTEEGTTTIFIVTPFSRAKMAWEDSICFAWGRRVFIIWFIAHPFLCVGLRVVTISINTFSYQNKTVKTINKIIQTVFYGPIYDLTPWGRGNIEVKLSDKWLISSTTGLTCCVCSAVAGSPSFAATGGRKSNHLARDSSGLAWPLSSSPLS